MLSLIVYTRANAELILAFDHCCGLKVLDSSKNNLHTPGGRALGNILPLKRFRVCNAKFGDEGISALNRGLENTYHIEHLYLDINDIHAVGISRLADSICAGKMITKYHLSLIEIH
jgi:hypothetical protein